MSEDLVTGLLDRLVHGDEAAATAAFRAFEPYLRMVVRRQMSERLRTKFDSSDVVQSVWADVWKGFCGGRWQFSDAAHLRAFLVRATRNRFLNRVRQQRSALDHEQPLLPGDGDSILDGASVGPSEALQSEDLWERMLKLCPPTHHELLRLRRQGLSLAEVAERTGLHPSSVRRILYELAHRLDQSSSPGG